MNEMTSETDEVAKKYCPRCETFKPISAFQKDRTHSDGLKSSCKECRNQGRKGEERKVTSIAKPALSENEKLQQKARLMAVQQLTRNHEREFRQLVAYFMDRVGVQKHWKSVS